MTAPDGPTVTPDLTPDGRRTARELVHVLREQVPGAAAVVLVEDDGHDDPQDRHGHLHSVVDATGVVLLSGSDPTYQDSDWSWDTDDLALDLHASDAAVFTRQAGPDARRTLRLVFAAFC